MARLTVIFEGEDMRALMRLAIREDRTIPAQIEHIVRQHVRRRAKREVLEAAKPYPVVEPPPAPAPAPAGPGY